MDFVSNFMAWMKLNWVLVAFLAAIIGGFLFLRTKPGNIDDAAELSAVLYDGRPTVLEFYSNF